MKFSPLFSRLALMLTLAGGFEVSAATPDAARNNGYTVTVDIHADETGEPQLIEVVSSEDTTTGKVLDKMAVVMAGKTKLPPRIKDGKPVKYTARAPFYFAIEDDEGPASDTAPKPRVKEARQPEYPEALRNQGVVGGAILELVIDAQGKLSQLKTLRASHPEFDAAATTSVKQWTFSPALQDGQPVASRTRLAIVFENEQDMAELKWRVPPRPMLGTFVVVRPNQPIDAEGNPIAPVEGAPATAPAPTAAPAP